MARAGERPMEQRAVRQASSDDPEPLAVNLKNESPEEINLRIRSVINECSDAG